MTESGESEEVMPVREAKVRALRWCVQMLEQRLRMATDQERPGLEVARRMQQQQLDRMAPGESG